MKIDQYTGFIDDQGKRQVHGSQIFKNGDTYEGEWLNDFADGKGKLVKESGDFYEGYWKNHELVGHTRFKGIDGSYYSGNM